MLLGASHISLLHRLHQHHQSVVIVITILHFVPGILNSTFGVQISRSGSGTTDAVLTMSQPTGSDGAPSTAATTPASYLPESPLKMSNSLSNNRTHSQDDREWTEVPGRTSSRHTCEPNFHTGTLARYPRIEEI